jgi:methylglutaconyl-CoA hydratase
MEIVGENMIYVQQKNGVGTLTLNRPAKHNAMNEMMIKELTGLFNDLNDEKKLSLLVIKGAGKSFSAGADLEYMQKIGLASFEENIQDGEKLHGLFSALYQLPVPVIAVAQGSAIGGGLGLLACADHVIAAKETKLSFSEVRIGLIPAVISPFVIEKIGVSFAKTLMLSGAIFQATYAEKIGLVHQVVAAEDLENETDKTVKLFSEASPEAARSAKLLIRSVVRGLQHKSASELVSITAPEIAKARLSKHGQIGMQAILKKAKPEWT